MSVIILFDKDTPELLAQFSRLKETKISRLGSDVIGSDVIDLEESRRTCFIRSKNTWLCLAF